MNFISKKTSLIILGVTAVTLSRLFFYFLDDPEGPNLLIVLVLAAFLYGVSLGVHRYSRKIEPLKRLLLTVFVQALIVIGLYLIEPMI